MLCVVEGTPSALATLPRQHLQAEMVVQEALARCKDATTMLVKGCMTVSGANGVTGTLAQRIVEGVHSGDTETLPLPQEEAANFVILENLSRWSLVTPKVATFAEMEDGLSGVGGILAQQLVEVAFPAAFGAWQNRQQFVGSLSLGQPGKSSCATRMFPVILPSIALWVSGQIGELAQCPAMGSAIEPGQF